MKFFHLERRFKVNVRALAAITVLILFQAIGTVADAQTTGGTTGQSSSSANGGSLGSGSSGETGYAGGDSDTINLASSEEITNSVLKQLERRAARCGQLKRVHRIDCLRQVFAQTAAMLGNRRDLADASGELRKLSNTLNGIVRRNRDRKTRKAKLGHTYNRAVKIDALEEAEKQAIAAIEETATKLLRSAGNSRNRKVPYTRIARAVNSTKKILRS
ncbi:hypothetical protein [Roseibium aggregatum]|uniref:LTXXQ motif family protein n=1 Tax=Roseibium aggregatum TaxID=187304 RepID=A0A939IZ58_9HYPH|nr:hypothetical protein [Roseibium aggregatum]MBN9669701.1 hypothetical protein [Roseibium aggregatum]